MAKPAGRNTTKIAIWVIGILLLAIIGGIGSCTYFVGRRVHHKYEEVKQAVQESKPIAALNACSLITPEELTEIYKKPFGAAVKDGVSCHFQASGNGSVDISVMPDVFQFLHAMQEHHAQAQPLLGARSFYANRTLFLSQHALFVKIEPLRGRADAEEIAKLVLARL